mmetsp:Transcript_8949/g.19131  ORF Transcript_8949/g.19131 Transcript_8949/m.19131 type:complete len:217 (-) Transcript_8949:271-921(-)
MVLSGDVTPPLVPAACSWSPACTSSRPCVCWPTAWGWGRPPPCLHAARMHDRTCLGPTQWWAQCRLRGAQHQPPCPSLWLLHMCTSHSGRWALRALLRCHAGGGGAAAPSTRSPGSRLATQPRNSAAWASAVWGTSSRPSLIWYVRPRLRACRQCWAAHWSWLPARRRAPGTWPSWRRCCCQGPGAGRGWRWCRCHRQVLQPSEEDRRFRPERVVP